MAVEWLDSPIEVGLRGTVDLSTYATVPVWATGAIFRIKGGSGSNSYEMRKVGATGSVSQGAIGAGMHWGICPMVGNQVVINEGGLDNNINYYLEGFVSGFVGLDTYTDITGSLNPDAWTTLDLATACPNATGIQILHTSSDSWRFGVRAYGATTPDVYAGGDGSGIRYAIVGSPSQKVDVYHNDSFDANWYVHSYFTAGFTAPVSPVACSPASVGSWQVIDISATTGAVNGAAVLTVFNTGVSANNFGVRKTGSTANSIYGAEECTAIVELKDGKFEGYINSTDVLFYLEGWISPPNNNIYLEMAFNQSIFTVSPTWTDVTSELMSLKTKRGRMHELDRIEAGTMEVTLNNIYGNWWRNNTAGVYYGTSGNVKPLTLIRLRKYYADIEYPIWYGVAESFNPDWLQKRGGYVPVMKIGCVDFFKTFAKFKIYDANPHIVGTAASGQADVVVDDLSNLHDGQWIRIYDDNNPAGEIKGISSHDATTNTVTLSSNLTNSYSSSKNGHLKKFPKTLSSGRVYDVVLELGFPISLCSIDTGQVYVYEVNNPEGLNKEITIEAGGINALEHLQEVTKDEDGLLFIAPGGKLTFQSGIARQASPYNTSQATFSDNV